MLSSIHPLGERGRHNRYVLTATAHVVAATTGGALTGAAAGLSGALITNAVDISTPVRLVLAGAVVLLAALIDSSRWTAPTSRRQVDERWLTVYRGVVYGAGYGWQLGLGVATIITTAAVHATVLLALLTGSIAGGALVGVVFGLVRGASVLTGARIGDTARLVSFHRRLESSAPAVSVATRAGLGALGIAALLAAASW